MVAGAFPEFLGCTLTCDSGLAHQTLVSVAVFRAEVAPFEMKATVYKRKVVPIPLASHTSSA